MAQGRNRRGNVLVGILPTRRMRASRWCRDPSTRRAGPCVQVVLRRTTPSPGASKRVPTRRSSEVPRRRSCGKGWGAKRRGIASRASRLAMSTRCRQNLVSWTERQGWTTLSPPSHRPDPSVSTEFGDRPFEAPGIFPAHSFDLGVWLPIRCTYAVRAICFHVHRKGSDRARPPSPLRHLPFSFSIPPERATGGNKLVRGPSRFALGFIVPS